MMKQKEIKIIQQKIECYKGKISEMKKDQEWNHVSIVGDTNQTYIGWVGDQG